MRKIVQTVYSDYYDYTLRKQTRHWQSGLALTLFL